MMVYIFIFLRISFRDFVNWLKNRGIYFRKSDKKSYFREFSIIIEEFTNYTYFGYFETRVCKNHVFG